MFYFNIVYMFNFICFVGVNFDDGILRMVIGNLDCLLIGLFAAVDIYLQWVPLSPKIDNGKHGLPYSQIPFHIIQPVKLQQAKRAHKSINITIVYFVY